MLKTINRLKLLKDYFLKQPKVSGLPIELVIEATNKCNLNCIMCSRKGMKRKIGMIDFSLFQKITDEISEYVELVYLHGLGEPLYHPDIFKMIKYAKAKKMSVGLSTNATLLTDEKAKKLLESGLDYLIIALDAATSPTYLKIRGGRNFNKVIRNVKNYLRLKRKQRQGPYTVIQFVKTKDNEKEAKRFSEIWQGKGAEAVRIKPVIDLLRLDKNKDKNFRRPCYYLWRQLNLISWDGKFVTTCCMDTGGDYSLGNVTQESIRDIWNGPKMVALRKAQVSGQWKKMPLCQNCTYPQPSSLGKLGGMIVPEIIIKKMLPFLENLPFGKFVIYD